MSRSRKLLFFLLLTVASWLPMQAVHEIGHMFGAWVSGGKVVQAVIHPLAISRTDVFPNPHPLVVVWAGPIIGVALPIAVWLAGRALRWRRAPIAQFFAGFCLIANGAYIGIGSFSRIGDCGEMLRNGAPIWSLWLFGVATFALGLYLWHSLSAELPRDRAEDKKV